MGLPYHFDVSEEVHDARRGLLDKYGLIAQASALGMLLCVGLYQWVFNRHAATSAYAPVPGGETSSSATGRGSGAGESHEMQSPDHFADALDEDEDEEDAHAGDAAVMADDPLGQGRAAGGGATGEKAPVGPSKLAAWLNTPLREGWKETRRHAVGIGLWGCWILSLCVRETGEDYLLLTKRFAHVAASLLPFHYLLGTSSRFSPLPRLFRTATSAAYNPFHRFHALLLFLLLTLHASFYINFYAWMNKLPGRLFDLVPFLGLCMLTTLAILAIFARQKVRYEARALFVASHLLGAFIVPALLYFHAGAARWYVAETMAVYVLVAVEKVLRRRAAKA